MVVLALKITTCSPTSAKYSSHSFLHQQWHDLFSSTWQWPWKNTDNAIIKDVEISPPQSKRMRLMSDEQDELSVLKLKYKWLFAKSENLQVTASHWKSCYNQTLQSQVPMTEATHNNMADKVMNEIVHSEDIFILLNWKHFTTCNKCLHHLADSMWYDKCKVLVLLQEFFLEHAITFIHKEVYSPSNVLRAMDMAGGLLSIEGIEVFCTCKTNSAKYYCHSILPCLADIWRVGAEVKAFAEKIIPYRHGTLNTDGKFVKWVPQEMISMVIKGFGLEDQAKERSITIHQAMDGVQLSKNIMHVTYGLKMAYCRVFVCSLKNHYLVAMRTKHPFNLGTIVSHSRLWWSKSWMI